MTTHTGKSFITFKDVSLGYGRKSVLSDLNFDLGEGDYIGIVGPNGAGKTTLLRAILGMLKPQKGQIVANEPVRFGYVPQAQTMDDFFPLSVLDIVLMGRYPAIGLIKRPSSDDREAALKALEDVGIVDLAHRPFRQLSGGQRQRTLMARALACNPQALILDEPTNDMDIAAEKATMELLDKLHEERGLLVLLVSHLLNVVLNHVHRVGILGNGRFIVDDVETLISHDRLSQLYGRDITVAHVDDRLVVL